MHTSGASLLLSITLIHPRLKGFCPLLTLLAVLHLQPAVSDSGLLHIMEAVAHFSYAASEAEELSFQKGDIIKVLEIEDDPNWFTAEIQGRRGYVPENYISLLPHLWFAGRVSRHEAEQRLRWQFCGAFLVRESESAPGEFSVSVSYGDMVEHFRVLEGAGQYRVWDESFLSLNRLVDFYRTHSIAMDRTVCVRDTVLLSSMDRTVCARDTIPLSSDSTLSPCPSDPGPNNPYPPNPYTTTSSRRQGCPVPQRDSSPCLLETTLGKPRVAQALVDYTPPHTAHLHFLRGDIINLLDCSSGSLSWRGRCRGRVGIFPPEFVQPVYH